MVSPSRASIRSWTEQRVVRASDGPAGTAGPGTSARGGGSCLGVERQVHPRRGRHLAVGSRDGRDQVLTSRRRARSVADQLPQRPASGRTSFADVVLVVAPVRSPGWAELPTGMRTRIAPAAASRPSEQAERPSAARPSEHLRPATNGPDPGVLTARARPRPDPVTAITIPPCSGSGPSCFSLRVVGGRLSHSTHRCRPTPTRAPRRSPLQPGPPPGHEPRPWPAET